MNWLDEWKMQNLEHGICREKLGLVACIFKLVIIHHPSYKSHIMFTDVDGYLQNFLAE